MKKLTNFTQTVFAFSFVLILTSCAANNLQHAEKMQSSMHKNHMGHSKPQSSQYALKENAVTQMGTKGNYQFTLYSNESSIPLNQIHSWTLHIETLDGIPLENAKVYVFGDMPMHKHDFPTVPKAKKYLGNGDYLIEGLKFNMIGHWEMRFNVKKNRIEDRVIFNIQL